MTVTISPLNITLQPKPVMRRTLLAIIFAMDDLRPVLPVTMIRVRNRQTNPLKQSFILLRLLLLHTTPTLPPRLPLWKVLMIAPIGSQPWSVPKGRLPQELRIYQIPTTLRIHRPECPNWIKQSNSHMRLSRQRLDMATLMIWVKMSYTVQAHILWFESRVANA